MCISSDPHQPLNQTLNQVVRCKEIMTARLSNGALVRSNDDRYNAILCMVRAQEELELAKKILFGDE